MCSLGYAGLPQYAAPADGDTAYYVDIAEADTGMKLTKIMVGGSRDGWHDFNAEYGLFSRRYTRRDDAPCGDEPMLMLSLIHISEPTRRS